MIYLNKVKVNVEKFPNNELRIRNLNIGESNVIDFKYESSDDLIALQFIKNEIKSQVVLFIRYMPYSRMDREFENDLFLLKYIANFINNLHFDKVFILEPHSTKTCELINNAIPIYAVSDLLNYVQNKVKVDAVVFPDHGAYLRYKDCFSNFLLFSKRRDESSTKIKELSLEVGEVSPSNYLIIDDICSSGNTCNLVAKILKKKGAKKVYVLVTHTENIALENAIIKKKYVDKIFTTDSLLTRANKKIEIIDFDVYNYIR